MSLPTPDTAFDAVTPAIIPDAKVRDYDNESLVWAAESINPTYLDPVATIIFQLLDGTVSVGELVEDVNAALGIPHGIARSRIRGVVELLDASNLIAGSPGNAALPPRSFDVFPGPPNN